MLGRIFLIIHFPFVFSSELWEMIEQDLLIEQVSGLLKRQWVSLKLEFGLRDRVSGWLLSKERLQLHLSGN